MQKIKFGCNLHDIGEYAFRGCSFSELVFPDSLKYLSEGAFENCDKLKIVTLGGGLNLIGKLVFDHCDSLEQIRVPSSKHDYYMSIGLKKYEKLVVKYE